MNISTKRLLNHLLLVGACSLSTQALASIPYVDHHIKVKQPDGTTLELVLNGTTHYADQRTLDGYPVIYDKTQKGYTFAKLSKDAQRFVSSGILVNEANKRLVTDLAKSIDIPKNAKRRIGLFNKQKINAADKKIDDGKSTSFLTDPTDLSGNVKGLTVLIQFPDQTGSIAKTDVENYANQLGYTGYGNAQSIRGYFRSVSGDKLDYTQSVVGYYTAKRDKSYYTDPNVGYGTRAQELIREALDWLENTQGYDFSTLSTNSGGKVLGLNVFYTGESDGGWAKGLWPHQGSLSRSWCADGVCLSGYQITNMSNALSIGTFIHESGHLIANWPDLYDYDGSSNGSAATHCVMGYGILGGNRPQKPVPPNGYFRHLAGWESVTELNPAVNTNAPTGTISHQANSNTLYRWSNPAKAGEAFYVETRTKTGQSEHMPDEGLVVWHIDKDGSNNDEWHPYVQMEHADGARQPENSQNRGDEYDMFDASYQNSFGYSQPNALASKGTNSRWWSGTDSGFELSNISAVSGNMTFAVGSSGPTDPTDPGTVELDDNVVTDVANANKGESRYFTFEVPQGLDSVLFSLNGSNGDADLYVKKGAKATETDNDCKSTSSNSKESCTLNAGAGIYHATVYAYSGFNGLTIKAEAFSQGGNAGDRYSGNLSGAGQSDIQPDGSWFQYGGGSLQGVLEGPANADFDLKLEKWQNGAWAEVAKSESSSSNEQINYEAASGYYRFIISSYSGSGDYTFDLYK